MRRHDPDALTAREREVLGFLRLGLTNDEIASRLSISLDGAKYHVSQILSKLGVATREEGASVALGNRRAVARGYMNLRRRKAAISAGARSNHSPPLRFCSNRLCQYASMPAGSSVLMTWIVEGFSGS
jgi:DNA-binding CsgD family transcriptional regulator